MVTDRINALRQSSPLRRCFASGLSLYACTSFPVFLGAVFASTFAAAFDKTEGLRVCARFDGTHYSRIAEQSYFFHPNAPSDVAFFPAYPLAGRFVSSLTGLGTVAALLLVSQVFLAASFVLLAAYVHWRDDRNRQPMPMIGDFPSADTRLPPSVDITITLLAFGLSPPTFFFRMAYSESMFVAFALATMLAIARRRSVFLVALLAGLGSAVRPVGVALMLPLVLYVWSSAESPRIRLRRLAFCLPLGLSGLAAYMGYQYAVFQTPFAFASTQEHWRIAPKLGLAEKAYSLVTWEPLWRAYDPSYPGYWKNFGPANPLLNCQFMNPIFFVGTIILIAIGGYRRWLNRYEFAFGLGVLAIPYLTRAHEMCLMSHARFSSVAFPVYLVVAILIRRWPPVARIGLGIAATSLLCVHTILFGMEQMFF